MKWGGRLLLVFFFFATLILFERINDIEASVPPKGYEVGKTVYTEGESRASIPVIRGMVDLALQSRINRKLEAAVLSLKNPAPGSTLHGDFTISFSKVITQHLARSRKETDTVRGTDRVAYSYT